MACNPIRLELSNTDATSVQITVSDDPGDGTTVRLVSPGLSIDASGNTTSAVATIPIVARTEDTNSLWDATIQVGANAPADIVIRIVETSAPQTVGLTVSDAGVTYCAPTAPGGGGASSLDDLSDVTISLPVAKQVLYYNGANWRNVSLTAADIPNLDASKTTSGAFDAARIPDLSSLYADATAAVPAGGTTGQVLSKASATDYDLTWSTATTGTVTSVGLSVPGGFTVAGTNPITSSGTFEITSTLSGVIVGDGAATFSGDGAINDLSDVNIATGAGNDGDLLYYDHAAGAGSKIKGIARSSIGLSEFDPDLGLGDLDDVTIGLLSDNLFLAYSNATSRWTGRSPAAARTALGLGTAATSDTGDFAAASHTHAATDITSGTLDAARLPAISDAYIMVIETPADQTYPLDPYMAEDRTISRLTVKTDSGTCSVLLAKNAGTSIGVLAASSSQNTTTTLANTSCSAGDRLYITVSSTSSADMLEIAVEYTQ